VLVRRKKHLNLHWTSEQILALAPDQNTYKRGQGLASAGKWLSMATNGQVVWGDCKSSGGTHYETAVDLKGPAFKCSCPSRKFPCKHAIGLLLLSNSDTDGFQITDELPKEVTAWINKRRNNRPSPPPQKSEEDLRKAEERKRQNFAKRMVLMEQGVSDLENWLDDLIRTGLASLERDGDDLTARPANSYHIEELSDLWQGFSMRMVDAKLPGIARRIREMVLIKGVGADWPERLLDELSGLYLSAKGFRQLPSLPPLLRQQLLSHLGVNTQKSELLNQPGISDEWMIVGQFEYTNIDHADVRRMWLLGVNTGRLALVVEYDYNHEGFQSHWPVGRIFSGEVVYYPSSYPLRALGRDFEIVEEVVTGWQGHELIEDFLKEYTQALGQQPWLTDFPALFTGVIPRYHEGKFYLTDAKGQGLPILDREHLAWKIISLSAGRPICLFGEWTGSTLHPLSVVADGRYVAL
jgi:hypothetical protein